MTKKEYDKSQDTIDRVNDFIDTWQDGLNPIQIQLAREITVVANKLLKTCPKLEGCRYAKYQGNYYNNEYYSKKWSFKSIIFYNSKITISPWNSYDKENGDLLISFPSEFLWDENLDQKIEDWNKQEEEKMTVAKENGRKWQEEQERKQLESLLAKYGPNTNYGRG